MPGETSAHLLADHMIVFRIHAEIKITELLENSLDTDGLFDVFRRENNGRPNQDGQHHHNKFPVCTDPIATTVTHLATTVTHSTLITDKIRNNVLVLSKSSHISSSFPPLTGC